MRVIKEKTLRDFWQSHPDSEQPLRTWCKLVTDGQFANSAELKHRFGGLKVINAERVVFKIKGNDYRLVVKINYPLQLMYIRFLGTHKEYDKIKVETI